MNWLSNYCPLVGECNQESVSVASNSYFLIQPFDEEKDQRERAIDDALKRFYGSKERYVIKKADSRITLNSNFCDICSKIKSSEYCIADISGESHTIIKNEKQERQLFLRPNVALELGMAYGFGKPSLIISREIEGKRTIPSDIEFVRWIGISFRDWTSVSQKILDRLRETEPRELLRRAINPDDKRSGTELLKQFYVLLHLKETLSRIQSKKFKISKIIRQGDNPIGILKGGTYLKEGIAFKLYITENEIEYLSALVEVDHLTPGGIAQVKFFSPFDEIDSSKMYWKNIARHFQNNNDFVPGKHRLELIIPDSFKEISTEQLKHTVGILRKVIQLKE
jgi:hypothetical protein